MVVGPVDLQGIISGECQIRRVDLVWNGVDVQNPFSRDFIHTPGTGAVFSQEPKRQQIFPAVAPLDFQSALILQNPNVFRRNWHS